VNRLRGFEPLAVSLIPDDFGIVNAAADRGGGEDVAEDFAPAAKALYEVTIRVARS